MGGSVNVAFASSGPVSIKPFSLLSSTTAHGRKNALFPGFRGRCRKRSQLHFCPPPTHLHLTCSAAPTSTPTSPPTPLEPTSSDYESRYPLPSGANIQTTTHPYSDNRGRAWKYVSDIIYPPSVDPNKPSTTHVVVCLHTASGLGVSKTYWDRLFCHVSSPSSTVPSHIAFARFDWLGNGQSSPKPDYVESAYDVDFFADQLRHFIRHLSTTATVTSSPLKVILLSQGASEPIALRATTTSTTSTNPVSALVVATGLSTRSMTTQPSPSRKQVAYSILRGPLGRAFWTFVARASYIEAFSKKNLLAGNEHLQQWVMAATEGAKDPRIRFNVFSFLSGHFFDDYTWEMNRLGVETNVKVAFMAGTLDANVTPTSRFRSVRPPVPIVVSESAFRDSKVSRMKDRQKLVKGCEGIVVENAGFEMFFEHVEKVMPYLLGFVTTV